MSEKPENSSSSDSSSESSSSTKSTGEAGKSSKESVGGAGAVHYGFFSNTKTPEYRDGWDAIWSKKNEPVKRRAAKSRAPKTIEIPFAKLPASVQEALDDVARKELKKSRISYDNRQKKGEVSWQISCQVGR
ncbi:MAG: hypothetical protein CMM52_10445 [Rhodospirillaceae bacterium]|nr:hypothetical protein [Rhodospirillaceae bacterium]|tara:strand:- start:17249 stop:17644 length:396 start_codon:yes stop_codon:yes gene_type:complete